MCTWCEDGGWRRRTCNFCGVDNDGIRPPVAISISIATGGDEDHPYTTTDLCAVCVAGAGDAAGIMAIARAHNAEIRETLGLTPART